MPTIPKIAIIGAGPAGLTLARLLHVSPTNFDITIYEIDSSATARPDQGGTLDLHDGTGLSAIRKCELWDDFRKHARYDGQELKMADKNATILVHLGGGEKGNEKDRPEIDRKWLKEILLDSLPGEYVKWGRHLREITNDGKLRFDSLEELDGPFDLIVGADGAWSKVRSRLHETKPAYAGVSGFEIEITDPAKTCPDVDKLVGRGSFFGPSDRKLLNGQRMGNGSFKVRTWFICEENEARDTIEKLGRQGTIDKTLEKYQGWAPEMTEFLRQGDPDTLRDWTLYELPVGCKWEHQKGYTLIGDAASLSTPFSGQGVNKAMKDALELAELLEQSQNADSNMSLDEAVQQYEKAMFPRSEKFQALTMSNKTAMFGDGTSISMMTNMIKTMAGDSPSTMMRLVSSPPVLAVVFAFFWILQQIGWAVRTFWRRT